MHSNPTVSLRPGGGGKGRLFGTFQESKIVLPARFTFDGKVKCTIILCSRYFFFSFFLLESSVFLSPSSFHIGFGAIIVQRFSYDVVIVMEVFV